MTEKQKYLLDFIKFFDEFSREHDIEYFLAGGSMLGAVRHRGFLPWDDDVDMYIKTSEWETAREKLAKYLPERYELVCMENTPGCNNPIIRIVDKTTSEFHSSRLADDTAHGIYLELFLLDPITNDRSEWDRIYNDFWVYCEGLAPYHTVVGNQLDISRLNMDDYFKFQKKMKRLGRDRQLRKKEKELFSYKEADCDFYHERWGLYWLTYPKTAFAGQLYVPFEDTMLPVASGWADVLYGEYGDNWNEVPDVEYQAIHPGYENYHVPYEYYDRDINASLDRGKYLDMVFDKKINRLKRFFLNNDIQRDILRKKNEMLIRTSDEAADRKFCEEALAEGNYQGIRDRLAKYESLQRDAYGYNLALQMDRDLRYALTYSLLMSGDIKYTDRQGKYLGDAADARMKEIFADLPRIREVRHSYFYGTQDKFIGECRELLGKYPDQVDLNEFRLMYDLANGGDNDELLARTNELIAKYPGRYRLLKIRGDIYRAKGETDKAKELYNDVLAVSNDGMANLEIRDILKEMA